MKTNTSAIYAKYNNGKSTSDYESVKNQFLHNSNIDNFYLLSVLKAMFEFIGEEMKGNCCSELRLVKKIEAARTLFPEHRKDLRNI
jgi:hypothetical protein